MTRWPRGSDIPSAKLARRHRDDDETSARTASTVSVASHSSVIPDLSPRQKRHTGRHRGEPAATTSPCASKRRPEGDHAGHRRTSKPLVSGFRPPARATVARLTSTKRRDGRLPGWGRLTSHSDPYRVCRVTRVSPLRDSRRSREGGFQARPISSMLPQPERSRTAGGIVYPLDQLTVSMSPRLAHPPRTSHSRNRPTLRQHRFSGLPSPARTPHTGASTSACGLQPDNPCTDTR